jgi:hypothetical protein
MSIWNILNYAAWGLCIFFVVLLAMDVIKIEKQLRKEAKNG